jgi:hypothetical protein
MQHPISVHYQKCADILTRFFAKRNELSGIAYRDELFHNTQLGVLQLTLSGSFFKLCTLLTKSDKAEEL